MARIDGDDGSFLIIQPLRYASDQFTPSVEHHDGFDVVYEDYSGNSLYAHLAASDGRHRRATDRGTPITWELHTLVRWLRVLADGVPHLARRWRMLDDHLEIEAVEVKGRVHLRVTLGIWPDDHLEDVWPSLSDDGYYHLEFALAPDVLRRFADELASDLAPFPIRFIETNGEASVVGRSDRYLDDVVSFLLPDA